MERNLSGPGAEAVLAILLVIPATLPIFDPHELLARSQRRLSNEVLTRVTLRVTVGR
jgi:hypothetical protein